MAIKMTKDVREYAISEFNKKVSESRRLFNLPYKEKLDKISEKISAVIEMTNEELRKIQEEVGNDFSIGINSQYLRGLVPYVIMKNDSEYQAPDMLKFLAELSTGESLDELSAMLDAYFK